MLYKSWVQRYFIECTFPPSQKNASMSLAQSIRLACHLQKNSQRGGSSSTYTVLYVPTPPSFPKFNTHFFCSPPHSPNQLYFPILLPLEPEAKESKNLFFFILPTLRKTTAFSFSSSSSSSSSFSSSSSCTVLVKQAQLLLTRLKGEREGEEEREKGRGRMAAAFFSTIFL